MKDHRLSDGAKLVAVVLCDTFANSKTALCYPGVKTLAETLGKSERSIRRALAELREAGWIVTEAGRRPHDRQGFIFTKGDGTVTMDEKVADLCAHRAAKAASEAEDGRTDMTARAVKFVRPYNKEGTKELNQTPLAPHERRRRTNPADAASRHARAEAGDAPGTASDAPGGSRSVAEKTGPARTGNARPAAPPPPPVPWQRVVPAGSAAEAEWNDWLKARDLPTLAELGRRASEAGAVGWAAPWKFPPPEKDPTRCEQAEEWAWWAVARMNDRARAAGPAHAL